MKRQKWGIQQWGRRQWIGVAAIGVATLWACGPKNPAPSPAATSTSPAPQEPVAHPAPAVAALYVADATTRGSRPVDLEEAIGPWIKTILEKESGVLAWAPDKPPSGGGHELRVAVFYDLDVQGQSDPDAEQGLAYVTVDFYASRKLQDGTRAQWTARGRAEAPFQRAAQSAESVYRTLVERATRSARASLELQLDLARAGLPALEEALGASDRRTRLDALSAVAERRDARAVAAVLPILKEPDEELVAAAVTTLAALDAEDAVQPLAALTSRNDPDLVLHVVSALGRMDNPMAKRYLEGIAETHAFEAVRAEAARHLTKEGKE